MNSHLIRKEIILKIRNEKPHEFGQAAVVSRKQRFLPPVLNRISEKAGEDDLPKKVSSVWENRKPMAFRRSYLRDV
jgi:hypothetical protein